MASYQGPNSCCSIGFFCWNLWSFSDGSGKHVFSKVDLYAALPLADTEAHTEQQGRRGSPLPAIRPAPSSELVSGPTALLPAQLPAGAPRGAAADSPRACQQSLASGFTWHTLSCRDLDKRTERRLKGHPLQARRLALMSRPSCSSHSPRCWLMPWLLHFHTGSCWWPEKSSRAQGLGPVTHTRPVGSSWLYLGHCGHLARTSVTFQETNKPQQQQQQQKAQRTKQCEKTAKLCAGHALSPDSGLCCSGFKRTPAHSTTGKIKIYFLGQ